MGHAVRPPRAVMYQVSYFDHSVYVFVLAPREPGGMCLPGKAGFSGAPSDSTVVPSSALETCPAAGES